MAIDAIVQRVVVRESGGGELHLVPRGLSAAGQKVLVFNSSPQGVEQLEGKEIWGGSSFIMLGEVEIAKRTGYMPIEFGDQETFNRGLRNYRCSTSQ